jgi:hypothetical protein
MACAVSALRFNTALAFLDLEDNGLVEGGERTLAETLRLNTTVTLLYLGMNRLGEGGGRALAEALRLNTKLRRSTSTTMAWERVEGGLAETLRLNTGAMTHLGEVTGWSPQRRE